MIEDAPSLLPSRATILCSPIHSSFLARCHAAHSSSLAPPLPFPCSCALKLPRCRARSLATSRNCSVHTRLRSRTHTPKYWPRCNWTKLQRAHSMHACFADVRPGACSMEEILSLRTPSDVDAAFGVLMGSNPTCGHCIISCRSAADVASCSIDFTMPSSSTAAPTSAVIAGTSCCR